MKIYTYSILRSTTPAFLNRIPYLSAIIEREDGTRFASLLEGYADGSQVKIDRPVISAGTDKNGRELFKLA